MPPAAAITTIPWSPGRCPASATRFRCSALGALTAPPSIHSGGFRGNYLGNAQAKSLFLKFLRDSMQIPPPPTPPSNLMTLRPMSTGPNLPCPNPAPRSPGPPASRRTAAESPMT